MQKTVSIVLLVKIVNQPLNWLERLGGLEAGRPWFSSERLLAAMAGFYARAELRDHYLESWDLGLS